MPPNENERLASLEAKMDLLIKNLDLLNSNLSTNYMPRVEAESRIVYLEKRIEKLENAPHKLLNNITSSAAVIIALLALFF